MVPKLDSYWQDTPHTLRDLEEENKRGPQPANAILVTADVVSLYTNIPQEESMEVFRQALNSSRFRPDPKLPTEFLMSSWCTVTTTTPPSSSPLTTTCKQDRSTSWTSTSGSTTKASSRPTSIKNQARSASFYFQAALTHPTFAAACHSPSPTE